MRGLTRRWVYRDLHRNAGTGNAATGGDGRDSLPLLERVLRARGLTDPDTVRRFCEPKLTDLYDPQLLPGIDAAAERLVAAVRGGESIVIYGDYDVDGISASAILYHMIKAAAPDSGVRTYVPHRLDDGYGLNGEALRQLRSEGASLVVSVDCGISAQEPARVAREAGLDLIITDHHNVDAERGLPDAAVIVHPRLPGSSYPFHELSGAGVAFKLAWRFATVWCGSPRVGESMQRLLLNLLPLAALGTIADVVPLVDENRTIASFGLRLIKQTPITGLRALIEASGLAEEEIDSQKIGFVLAPRLNACGRMGHAAEAVHLLTSAAPAEARAIAQRLAHLNRERQETERSIAEHAAQMAEDAGMTADDRRAIVLADEGWHPGVVGIACSRLAERYGRPVVLLQRQGDHCKGSARSVEGYSIHAGLTATAKHLQRFGGHDAAAGLTLRAADLGAFTEALIEHANAHIDVEQMTPTVGIDCDARLEELDFEVVKRIAALSPFGHANPRPAVRLTATTLAEPPRQMGSYGRHLALRLRQEGAAGRRWIRAVWWNGGSLAADLGAGMRLDAVVEPKLNAFSGRVSVEAEVRDVRVVEESTARSV
ncbi:MAG: single-stranded-DNA-specific exonuclease RecJ [Planctomycetota bacterium]|jgi:single-stranded-DNA-specific exonuclease